MANNDGSEAKLYMWVWGCLSIVAIAAISCITYYNTTVKSKDELKFVYDEKKLAYYENMMKIYNVSPMVLECVDRPWDNVPTFIICNEVMKLEKLTKDDIEKMASQLEK